MENKKTKTKIITILAILILTTTALYATLPTVTAQQYDESRITYAYIGATPNPVGVNQQVLLHVGIMDYLYIASDGWEGLTVTVTKPDGQTETLGPFRTDSTGGTGTIYTPTMQGTYKLQTHYPQHIYTWPDTGRAPISGGGTLLYQASDSPVLDLVVQAEPVPYYPDTSLPNEYWSRPINAQLREWKTIAGSWLDGAYRGGVTAPFNDGPETAHILWTEELTMGGLVGGDLGDQGMVCGDAYEGKYLGSVIINGIFYFNRFEQRGGNDVEQQVVAINLHTGEELWSRTFLNNEQIDFGQQMYWDTMNMHGVYTYLWATDGRTWMAFDAQTGRWVYNMTNVPSGSNIRGPNGEILRYSVDLDDGLLTRWNSTAVYYNTLMEETDNYEYYSGRWRPQGRSFDGSYGIDLEKTIPLGLPGSARAYYIDDRILGVDITKTEVSSWAISLEPGKEGQLLFQNTWPAPAEWATSNLDITFATGSPTDGVFALWAKEIRKYYGFNIDTGAFLWETDSEHYMNCYVGTNRMIAYGKLFSVGYAGIVYAYDVNDGQIEWTYHADDEFNEILWCNGWPLRIQFIADGKIYVGMEEHSSVDPKPRGAPYFCLDINNGEEIWRINGGFRQNHWGGNSIIGDGIIAAMDAYDQRIYAIGKGPSATTIEAPLVSVPKGNGVILVGRVTDVSPGTNDYALTARFPNGVPVVADKDMSGWMKYVYMQFSIPDDVSGVTVHLEAIDPDGEYLYIGAATTDVYGNYGFQFNPNKEGKYMIMASFKESGAYYGSTDTTYLGVGPVITPSGPITPETPAPLISTEAAIIGAVSIAAVLGLASFAIIRKRK